MSRQSQDIDLSPTEWELVVTLNKERFTVKTCWTEEGFTVDIDGKKEVVLNTDWLVGEPMMLVEMNGKEVTIQVSTGCFFTSDFGIINSNSMICNDVIFVCCSMIVVEEGDSISDTMGTR